MSLIRSLLQKNPRVRLGALCGIKEILAHPWFGVIRRDQVLDKKLIPPIKILSDKNLSFDFSAHKEHES